jgi:hypothetical protein
MSQLIQRIDNLGRRESTTVAASTNQRLFAGTTAPVNRQSVSLCNLDLAADLLVAFTAAGAADPGMTSSNCDLVIAARSSRELLVGCGVDVWVRTTSASPAPYAALELL